MGLLVKSFNGQPLSLVPLLIGALLFVLGVLTVTLRRAMVSYSLKKKEENTNERPSFFRAGLGTQPPLTTAQAIVGGLILMLFGAGLVAQALHLV